MHYFPYRPPYTRQKHGGFRASGESPECCCQAPLPAPSTEGGLFRAVLSLWFIAKFHEMHHRRGRRKKRRRAGSVMSKDAAATVFPRLGFGTFTPAFGRGRRPGISPFRQNREVGPRAHGQGPWRLPRPGREGVRSHRGRRYGGHGV